MSVEIVRTNEVQDFLKVVSGLTAATGNARTKQVVHRILSDLYEAIEDLDVTPDEFWAGISYLNSLGSAGEAGLLAAGTGLEHYLDLRMDAAEAAAGITNGTPRTIEGPLYVANAPLSVGTARLDDGTDTGTVLIMRGVVKNLQGKPLQGAVVDVWHCNTKGLYSTFDKDQAPYNLRRRIETYEDGRYEFRSIVPSGYGCPPDGPTQAFLNAIGRHGQRPAHIHFMISAPGHRHLTTQINIAGDRYLRDDFAYATREDLICPIHECRDEAVIRSKGLEEPFALIDFDFILTEASEKGPGDMVHRQHAAVA